MLSLSFMQYSDNKHCMVANLNVLLLVHCYNGFPLQKIEVKIYSLMYNFWVIGNIALKLLRVAGMRNQC